MTKRTIFFLAIIGFVVMALSLIVPGTDSNWPPYYAQTMAIFLMLLAIWSGYKWRQDVLHERR
jgi:hypothetical protein